MDPIDYRTRSSETFLERATYGPAVTAVAQAVKKYEGCSVF